MILFITIFIFLFTLYVLSLDDFVFLRKNVSQIILFDIVLVSGLVGLFFSRLAYALLHPSFAYFNPLVFFIVPYFPGLSLSGFLIGGCLTIYMLCVRRKLPMGRIFDVFALSLYPASAVFFLGEVIQDGLKKDFFLLVVSLGSGMLFMLLFFFFKRFLTKSAWHDGSMSITLLAVFAVLHLINQVVQTKLKAVPLEASVFAVFFCILFISFLFKKFKRL